MLNWYRFLPTYCEEQYYILRIWQNTVYTSHHRDTTKLPFPVSMHVHICLVCSMCLWRQQCSGNKRRTLLSYLEWMWCHDFCRCRYLSLFGWCSAFDVTGLLAIIDPFFIFHWFCLVFPHTCFQSHSLPVVYLTLCFPSCLCQRLFIVSVVFFV